MILNFLHSCAVEMKDEGVGLACCFRMRGEGRRGVVGSMKVLLSLIVLAESRE